MSDLLTKTGERLALRRNASSKKVCMNDDKGLILIFSALRTLTPFGLPAHTLLSD